MTEEATCEIKHTTIALGISTTLGCSPCYSFEIWSATELRTLCKRSTSRSHAGVAKRSVATYCLKAGSKYNESKGMNATQVEGPPPELRIRSQLHAPQHDHVLRARAEAEVRLHASEAPSSHAHPSAQSMLAVAGGTQDLPPKHTLHVHLFDPA